MKTLLLLGSCLVAANVTLAAACDDTPYDFSEAAKATDFRLRLRATLVESRERFDCGEDAYDFGNVPALRRWAKVTDGYTDESREKPVKGKRVLVLFGCEGTPRVGHWSGRQWYVLHWVDCRWVPIKEGDPRIRYWREIP